MPVGLRVVITLVLPVAGAISVAGVYFNKEVLVAAAWIAFSIAATVFIRPVVGVAAMTATFMLVAYPTILQTLGFLTINNLLGLCLAAVLVAHVVTTRDVSPLKTRQVIMFGVIGILLVLSTAHADVILPVLRKSQSLGIKGKFLDRTGEMMHDYWVRLIFLVFFFTFVRTARDIRAMFFTFVLVLFLAVPSALINWMQGNLAHGFRAAASITAGANANRLAMICLMEIACWWAWAVWRGGTVRWAIALGAIGASFLVVLASGSRSGVMGCGVLALLIQTGPRRFRASTLQLGILAFGGALAVATIVPAQAWERAMTFSTENRFGGATASRVAREQTIDSALLMIRDHPFLGIGIGNFREVARQVYRDPYFRPPHNSYLWAASEGGLFVLVGYLLLFWFTWRDLGIAARLIDRDPSCVPVVVATRVMVLLYAFFALFADLWLNPITYVLIGSAMVLRRHLEQQPAAVAAVAAGGVRRLRR
jgi:O-antigen ligase